MNFLTHHKYKFFLFFILLIAVFLRFYQLGGIPAGLTNDEANTGYDAYSILLTGKDQWGTFLPTTNFIGFGDYPPSVYRYLTIIPIYFFGLNQFSIRMVSALAGVLSVLALYFLIRKLFNEKAAIFSSFLFAIMPWAVGLSRIGIESNVAILLILIALWFGIKKDKKHLLRDLSFSAIFLSLSIYTYSAYTLFSPIIFLLLILINLKNKLNLKFFAVPVFIFLIFIIPIILQKNSASTRFSQVGFTTNINSIGLKDTLNMQIGQCQSRYNPVICRVFDNKIVLFSSTFVKNYLSHFSPNFLYISGTPTQYSILDERGVDYLFGSVLLILGFYYLLKINKDKKLSFLIIFLFLLAPVPDALTGDGNYSRASIMQPFIVLMDGLGLFFVYTTVKNIDNKYIKNFIFFISAFIIIFSSSSFFIRYTTYFKNNYSIFSQYGYEDLMTKVAKDKSNYERIYISSHLNDAKQYVYYLFYNKYNPSKYQSKKEVSYNITSSGWISIDRLENIYFISNILPIEEDKSLSERKVLIISNPKDFPKNLNPIFTVKDKLSNVIFKAVSLSDLLEYKKTHKLDENESSI